MAMSTSQNPLEDKQHITPPSSFISAPLTPPSTDEKAFTQAPRVIALFKLREAGKHFNQHPWTEFQLAPGEYDEIERQLRRDESLFGFVKDKVRCVACAQGMIGTGANDLESNRYDYCGRKHQLVVRMPTGVHEIFIDRVEDAIRRQLRVIRSGSDRAAIFAQKVWPTRSTEINFPVDDAPPGTQSKHEPDATFWHDDAEYPGVIIEVSYSQKRKMLGRLAEDYLLDSDASVQVVIGLDVEYGKKSSRKATLSVWRTHVVHTGDEKELRVVQVIADEVCPVLRQY